MLKFTSNKNMKNPSFTPSLLYICLGLTIATLTACTKPDHEPQRQNVVSDMVAIAPYYEQSERFAHIVTTSIARVASETKDTCPKLLEFKLSNETIVRKDEELVSSKCDYLIYLNQGDVINIHVSENIRAEIISPTWVDLHSHRQFVAPKFDRYTLRLSYNGIRFQPQDFRYDVTVSKNPDHVYY